jgi:hypothetical protein
VLKDYFPMYAVKYDLEEDAKKPLELHFTYDLNKFESGLKDVPPMSCSYFSPNVEKN